MQESYKTFLLVDDDADDRELFSEALSEVDPTVKFCYAPNGKIAMEKLQELGPSSIIFLDINMPEMGGFECLSLLKKKEDAKDIPVLMFTTSANKQDIKAAGELGALCFITKPNKYQNLKNIIKTVIAHLEIQQLDTLCEAIYKSVLSAS